MAGLVGFVGREGELSRLLGALGGDARLVLVVGDAGVGKTRFVTEGMARAEAAGMVMIRGECLPLTGTLPLLPVADALAELGELKGGALLAAALDSAPAYVRDEIGRLLPQMSRTGGTAPDDRDGEWSRERLFTGVAELLATVAARSPSGVVLAVEDVHWADGATLDFLTFLARAGRRDEVRVVVTCRGDEAPLAAHVAGWLAQVRASAGVEEVRLLPLSRAEVAEQVTALAAGPVSPQVIDHVFARAEGNPFFTEQLVAAALTPTGGGDPRTEAGEGLRVPAGLPARLAELLTSRADRCAGDARAVLAGLAVAGRPLTEDVLGAVTGLSAEAVRAGLRELAAARLLAEGTAGEGHRPRHALLAEAVAGGLLPGERAVLHGRTARALAAAGDQALAAAGRAGLQAWQVASILADNAAEALLALGRTAEAGALLEPLTTGAPDSHKWLVQVTRAEIDLLRGDPGAAARRWRQIYASPSVISRVDFAYEAAPRAAEAALWAGRPGDALDETRRALALFKAPDLTVLSGRLLNAGLRACADLAEQARARHDETGAEAAAASADGLARWAGHMGGAPFNDHPFVAAIPAERATWDAERTRLAGPSDPDAWAGPAKAWQDLGCPHRAGYAWWRQAQAQLDAGPPAAAATGALRAAAAAAHGHVPLLDQIRALADRARIPLPPPDAGQKTPAGPPRAEAPTAKVPYGLTGRELAVLRLLAAGRTNAQIGAELYISPKTAGVHVSNILRKLGVPGRVQAAAVAERAGLLPASHP